jgi:hypothetical protein
MAEDLLEIEDVPGASASSLTDSALDPSDDDQEHFFPETNSEDQDQENEEDTPTALASTEQFSGSGAGGSNLRKYAHEGNVKCLHGWE